MGEQVYGEFSISLHVILSDSSKFSVLGETWAMRLGFFDKVPEGWLLVDGLMEGEPVRMEAQLKRGTLYFTGKVVQ